METDEFFGNYLNYNIIPSYSKLIDNSISYQQYSTRYDGLNLESSVLGVKPFASYHLSSTDQDTATLSRDYRQAFVRNSENWLLDFNSKDVFKTTHRFSLKEEIATVMEAGNSLSLVHHNAVSYREKLNDQIGFKLNGQFVRNTNRLILYDDLKPSNNLHIYGDENSILFDTDGDGIAETKLGREGYRESVFAGDQHPQNWNADLSIHYKPFGNLDDLRIDWKTIYAKSATNFQSASRYKIDDYQLMAHQLKIKDGLFSAQS